MAQRIKGPWLLGGDFNTILNAEDKIGHNRHNNEITPFRDCLNKCGLEDIKFSGRVFTWSNK